MAKVRLITMSVYMVNAAVGRIILKYIDGNDENKYLRHEMLLDAYLLPLLIVFAFPMLSIYNHTFLKKKYLRLINRVSPDPIYNTNVWILLY